MARARQARPLPDFSTLAPMTSPRIPQPPASAPGNSIGTERQAPTPDIAALARQGSALGASAARQGGGTTGLRVFVTLDMPIGSLQRLVEQCERSGATLVLRGLQNQSLRQTLARVQALLGQRRVSWQIDPEAFEHYRVQAAPTFVLDLPGLTLPNHAAAPNAQCAPGSCTDRQPHVMVSGDVSLDYALQAMARRLPMAAPRALELLRRLQ